MLVARLSGFELGLATFIDVVTLAKSTGLNSMGRSGLQYRLYIIRQSRTLAILSFTDSFQSQ